MRPDPHAAERVVVLAPAAADVIRQLGAAHAVVGVTNSVTGFPHAATVGTHLNPGVETVAALRPDLIVAGPRFNPELAARMGAAHILYAPTSLDGIIEAVHSLGGALGREREAEALAGELRAVLDGLTLPEHRPTVLYETRSNPLSLARHDSVTRDLLERAGLRYAWPDSAGAVSAEYLLANQPDYYLYQEGPMNRNPVPPEERPGWDPFGACAVKVDEFSFSRPDTTLFETVRKLNDVLNAGGSCKALSVGLGR